MTAFLLFCVALPAIAFGALFQNGPEVVLGLRALGMSIIGFVIACVWRDVSRNHKFLHGPRR